MKILVADDDIVSRRLVMRWLSDWGYVPLEAANGEEAWSLMQGIDAPRLAILDWIMPGPSGIEICQRVRSRGEANYSYLLLLSACDSRENLVDGLNAGADDYLMKPVHPAELRARLCVGRRILAWQDQLLAARELLRHQATHDVLTGILSRAALLEEMSTEWQRLSRENGSIGLILADLDHFKDLNDTFGHAVGDQALKMAARRMQSTLRPYDRLGRYGGEEFLAVLPGCNLEQTGRLAERLLASLREEALALPECEVRLTASLGATACLAGETYVPENLIKVADLAMYRAKRAGRNRVVVLGPHGPFRSQGATIPLFEDFAPSDRNKRRRLSPERQCEKESDPLLKGR